MLGHTILLKLKKRHTVIGTIRSDPIVTKKKLNLIDTELIGNIDACHFESITEVIERFSPDIIVNCIGIIKQLPQAQDPIISISINALFPHKLAQVCYEKGIRLIHYSTDCVFSGKTGNYQESDFPDADDLYGRTKLLGEVTGNGCLTLRTSMIGRELSGFSSLLEWVFNQEGKVISGYTNALFSGLTTLTHAKVLDEIISNNPGLNGLYHLASTPISKYDLIRKIICRFNLNIALLPDDSVICFRNLDPTRFISDTKIIIPTWDEMIDQLYNDKPPINNADVYQ